MTHGGPEETRVAEGPPRSWTELRIGHSTAELTGDLRGKELVGQGGSFKHFKRLRGTGYQVPGSRNMRRWGSPKTCNGRTCDN